MRTTQRLHRSIRLFLASAALTPILLSGCETATTGEDALADQNQQPDQQQQQQDVDLSREIEEADIVKEIDGFFYIANPYKGLRIIDARDMARPTLAGGLAVAGRGVELFVRDDRAYLFTAADFVRCAGRPVGFDQAQAAAVLNPDYDGSRLWVIDVSNPAAPVELGHGDFAGFVDASRRVGDVIYAAGKRYIPYQYGLGPAPQTGSEEDDVDEVVEPRPPSVFVTSINIADPSNVRVVETEEFTAASAAYFFDVFALDIHVSDTAIYVLDPESDVSQTTIVTYLDITDPEGAIAVRDQFRVPGLVQNRFFADEFQGVFRIVTEERVPGAFTQAVRLYTYNVVNPDDIQRLAETPIISGESLRAVRFDGTRGYAVTFLQVDPLFVLDLANPAAPAVTGQLEVPGFSTYLFPLGNRLVAVGFDDTAGVRPAVALYNVADAKAPTQLSRIILGETGSFSVTSEATADEKAIKILESAGLILMPFSFYDRTLAKYVDALQIIGLGADALTQRGQALHEGLVRRAGLRDGRLWVLSDLSFQALDIANLDSPASLGTVAIVAAQELLDSGLSSCADSARWRGTSLGGPFFGPDEFFTGGVCFPFAVGMIGLSLLGCFATRRRR
jgi:hypothetical protein